MEMVARLSFRDFKLFEMFKISKVPWTCSFSNFLCKSLELVPFYISNFLKNLKGFENRNKFLKK